MLPESFPMIWCLHAVLATTALAQETTPADMPPNSWRPPLDQSLWRLLKRAIAMLADLWPFGPRPDPYPYVAPIVDVTPPPQVFT